MVKTKNLDRHGYPRFKIDLWKLEKVEVEIEHKQVCIRSTIRTTTQIFGQPSRNQGKF
jgi:hypothetical protein